MNITYLRFYKGLKVQRIDRTKFSYYSGLQPYLAWWAIGWITFFILINGYTVFWVWETDTFITDYINIPIFIVPYVFWKFYKRTRAWRPEEMDFVTVCLLSRRAVRLRLSYQCDTPLQAIPTLEETEVPEEIPTTFWGKVASWLF